jgi:gamma-glutamyltranspeptidase/glutathione hydrolase
VGVNGAVSSAEPNASEVGLALLKGGGNAVDAAVGIGLALAVTHPTAGNLGGGGFMVVRLADGKSTAIDFREMAPGKATRDMYLDKKGKVTNKSRVGALAAGIPGNLAGFAYAHEHYGKLPWKDVVAPAVRLAKQGHVIDSWHADDMQRGAQRMDDAGFPDSAKYFRKPDGTAYAEGDTWVQPELAGLLEQVAEKGKAAFYEGAYAEDMATKVRKLGGIWTAEDLANYKAIEREPLEFTYRGHEIIAMPPPSAGGVVLRQILAGEEVLNFEQHPYRSVEEIHLYVETLKRTYADRNMLIADPDFVEIPIKRLLDVSYVDDRLADVSPDKSTPSEQIKAGVDIKESTQTTHFSVVDGEGNAVANTFTLNGGFGAKVMIPGTGIILNNEMDDFTAKPGEPNMFGLVQGPQNAIEPGKRMLSSMTPTIVVKDGELRAVVGSPGGPTITTTVAQIIMQIVMHGRTISEAVRAPRVHHQWLPDTITHEPGLDPAVIKKLGEMGHHFREWGRIGHANCIEVDPETHGFRAVADATRDGGKALAY